MNYTHTVHTVTVVDYAVYDFVFVDGVVIVVDGAIVYHRLVSFLL